MGHSWKNISYMSQHTMQVGHNQSFIFYMSTINLESDRTLDFLKKHMQICLLKNGLENSIPKQSQSIKNILTFTNFTL